MVVLVVIWCDATGHVVVVRQPGYPYLIVVHAKVPVITFTSDAMKFQRATFVARPQKPF